MENEKKQDFIFYIGPEKENVIVGKYVCKENYKDLEAFSIALICSINGKPIEIIRFDCTRKEDVNVHKFYKNPPVKE